MTDKEERDDKYDFDLPDVSDGKKAVRVHNGPGDSVCTSCEG